LTALLSLSPAAMASEHSVLHRMSCAAVRYYVALYSATAAEQYARSQGASDAEIEKARRCIRTETPRTASAQ
jgi:hypothetical protein